jgi:nicotinamidase/pyrazinamidase
MLVENDALLAVDVQRDFEPGGTLAVPNGDEIVPPLAACIDEFERRNLPIIASRDWHPPDHCSFEAQGGPWPPHCIAETAGAEFDPGLNLPDSAKIIDKAMTTDKDAYSAFEDTELHAYLQGEGVTRLFIGGLATEYCVLNTARDALGNGYDVVLLEDAIRAIDPADGENAIRELQDGGAKISQSSELIDG